MENKDKNINKSQEIADMLGWKYTEETGYGYHGSSKGESFDYRKYRTPFGDSVSLEFAYNANWQFEAIDWIEKQGYNWQLTKEEVYGYSFDWFDGEHRNVIVNDSYYKSPKEAIFEALYQFSQYIKQKDK